MKSNPAKLFMQCEITATNQSPQLNKFKPVLIFTPAAASVRAGSNKVQHSHASKPVLDWFGNLMFRSNTTVPQQTESICSGWMFQGLQEGSPPPPPDPPHRCGGGCSEASWLLGNGWRYLQLTGGCAAAGCNYTSCCVEQNLQNHLICFELATFECKHQGGGVMSLLLDGQQNISGGP